MDPNACIQHAIDAALRGAPETVARCMKDYADWRNRGGFAAEDRLIEELNEVTGFAFKV